MKTLKIGFVGSGFIARFLATAMIQVRNCELSGIYKRGGAAELSDYARKNDLGNATLYNSIKELANNVDAIAIFSPNYTRIEVLEEIVEAVSEGAELVGVICEKPLGRNIAEARLMVDLARKANLKTAYFENQIYMRVLANALTQLQPQQEAMGHFTLARSTEEHAGPHNSWFWDPRQQGGGVLSDMGCHSIAVCKHILTPSGKDFNFLQPVSIQADTSLLKWGRLPYKEMLLERYGVDYSKTPAEDFATGIITFKNPQSGQLVKGQFTNSWMYDKQGLRISVDGLGPGFALEVNTLISPLQIFIGDEAADGTANAELALEKSTATRGLLAVQPNEADLYGYVDELKDVVQSFIRGEDALLSFEYGLEITRLVQAAYMSAEKKQTIDLTVDEVNKELDNYQSLISQGKGADLLYN